MNILFVAAHPDDEVLGCGGTIARLVHEGHNVTIAILGEGITSRYLNREQTDSSLTNSLHNCSRKAAELLGVKNLLNYNFPDNRFDTIPLLDIVKAMENILEKVDPQVIYTHFGGDLNIDHELTYRATLTAARPLEGTSVRTIYAYEVPSSTEWAFHKNRDVFTPNVFMDISKTIDVKLKAMEEYESEIRQFPHPRSSEGLESIARRWGSVVGLHAAEAFELVRDVH